MPGGGTVRLINEYNPLLQALLVLNNPAILESSRVFAERLMQEKLTDLEKIEKAFRSIVCRKPKAKEVEILTAYFSEEKVIFKKSLDKAKQLISVGEYPHTKIDDVVSLASLMQVIHTIYNMEESISKT